MNSSQWSGDGGELRYNLREPYRDEIEQLAGFQDPSWGVTGTKFAPGLEVITGGC